ncbi:MAG TPA: hypothetical protein VNJ09_08825 [Chthonomonadales bacterium]|nr:hypothetical protein [Chthonomonadales bacterium]
MGVFVSIERELPAFTVQAISGVDVAPPGHGVRIQWTGARGANGVEVTQATAEIGPALAQQTFDDWMAGTCDHSNFCEVNIQPNWLLDSLALIGLEVHDSRTGPTEDVSLKSQSDLVSRGLRLVVSTPSGPNNAMSPAYSVPSVGQRGMLPPMLTGASFSAPAGVGHGVLNLPEVPGPKVRLSVASGNFPEEFAPLPISVDSVSAQAVIPPRNLQLLGPDGAAVWAFPGVLPPQSPRVEVDLRLSIQKALDAALKSGQPLDATFTLRGDAPGRAYFRFTGARGTLLRTVSGVLQNKLEGDPARLELGEPPADETPASAVADLSVKYEGIRILETVSDPFPSTQGNIGGPVVTSTTLSRSFETSVTRAFPPEALRGFPVARIGLVGRAPEACELSVQLVEMGAGMPGAALGPPGVVKLQATEKLGTVWVEMPAVDTGDRPVGVSVRANQGRFFWASGAAPLVRVAVRDPHPGGRPLKLGGQTVLMVTEEKVHLLGKSLPTGVFRSVTPVWESSLFLTVEIADLVLRYAR